MWSVLVPVKRLPRAKSRLGPRFAANRAGLALAFACDTVAAAAASPLVARVYVVTGDPAVAAATAALGATVLPDGADDGLNEALEAGARRARAEAPAHRVAALTADLPGLRTQDLTAVLEAAGHGRAFVPDALGTGTTLLLSDARGVLGPRFGPGSRRLHEDSGAVPIPTAGRSLRQDVDTPEDLDAAAVLGLGPHTASELAGIPAQALSPTGGKAHVRRRLPGQ